MSASFSIETLSACAWTIGIIGLLANVVVIYGLYLERTKRQGDVERPLRDRRGELWIIIGIVAEIIFGTAASILANRVETRQRAEIAALNKDMLPRHIYTVLHLLPPLKAFAHTTAFIDVIQDTEPKRLLVDRVVLLQHSGWHAQVKGEPFVSELPDGIEIIYRADEAAGSAKKAATELSRYLGLPEIDVENHVDSFSADKPPAWWPLNFVPDQGSVCIFIGLRPVGGSKPYNWFNPVRP